MSCLKNCLKRPHLLDGGLGMQLIHDGYKTIEKNPLWSAELVYSNPEAIESTHLKFLEAGAEIVETATYQMSFEGFSRHLGLNSTETERYFEKAVRLVRSAIEKHVMSLQKRGNDANRPILVAGSVGPYGAVLADRSEYSGAYWDLSNIKQHILDEHRMRISALIRSGVDLIAAETLPSTEEADIFVKLMAEFSETPFYLSFVTSNGTATPRGENLLDYLKNLPQKVNNMSQLVGVGLNCSSIECISSFIEIISRHLPELPANINFLFYANLPEPLQLSKSERLQFWHSKLTPWLNSPLGKSKRIFAIGGCCNVINEDIFAISQVISL